MPLSVGRPQSLAAVEAALAAEDKTLVLVAQREATNDNPGAEGMYTIGTRAVIKKMARNENVVELLLQGVERVVILKMEQSEPFLKARVTPLPLPDDTSPEMEALARAILELAARALQLAQPQAEINIQQIAAQAANPILLAYLIGSMLSLDVPR